ncbi:hypothetical protein Dimus_035136 [Dionaea muscipula]
MPQHSIDMVSPFSSPVLVESLVDIPDDVVRQPPVVVGEGSQPHGVAGCHVFGHTTDRCPSSPVTIPGVSVAEPGKHEPLPIGGVVPGEVGDSGQGRGQDRRLGGWITARSRGVTRGSGEGDRGSGAGLGALSQQTSDGPAAHATVSMGFSEEAPDQVKTSGEMARQLGRSSRFASLSELAEDSFEAELSQPDVQAGQVVTVRGISPQGKQPGRGGRKGRGGSRGRGRS